MASEAEPDKNLNIFSESFSSANATIIGSNNTLPSSSSSVDNSETQSEVVGGRKSRARNASTIDFSQNVTWKRAWTVQEDEKLREFCQIYGTAKWALIAEHLVDRSGKQCRERWHNHLAPAIKKGGWTKEEDAIIMVLQKKYGNQWSKITKCLEGRTDNAVKNRFHVMQRANKGSKGLDLELQQCIMSLDMAKLRELEGESGTEGAADYAFDAVTTEGPSVEGYGWTGGNEYNDMDYDDMDYSEDDLTPKQAHSHVKEFFTEPNATGGQSGGHEGYHTLVDVNGTLLTSHKQELAGKHVSDNMHAMPNTATPAESVSAHSSSRPVSEMRHNHASPSVQLLEEMPPPPFPHFVGLNALHAHTKWGPPPPPPLDDLHLPFRMAGHGVGTEGLYRIPPPPLRPADILTQDDLVANSMYPYPMTQPLMDMSSTPVVSNSNSLKLSDINSRGSSTKSLDSYDSGFGDLDNNSTHSSRWGDMSMSSDLDLAVSPNPGNNHKSTAQRTSAFLNGANTGPSDDNGISGNIAASGRPGWTLERTSTGSTKSSQSMSQSSKLVDTLMDMAESDEWDDVRAARLGEQHGPHAPEETIYNEFGMRLSKTLPNTTHAFQQPGEQPGQNDQEQSYTYGIGNEARSELQHVSRLQEEDSRAKYYNYSSKVSTNSAQATDPTQHDTRAGSAFFNRATNLFRKKI